MSVDIDQADYTAIRKRAVEAETELAIFHQWVPLVTDYLNLFAHLQEVGVIGYSPDYPLPSEIRKAAAALPQEVE